jgi:multidrug efflux pump subunit AcrA (membrane-fusion protein)
VVAVGDVVAKMAFRDDSGSIIEVTSLYAGTVTRVAVRRDDEIRANAMLIALENEQLAQSDTPAPLEAVIYLPYRQVLMTHIGMEALVIPQGIEASQYGVMRGKVRAVAQFPATDAFARAVSPQDPVVAVYITLDTDADGRYVWTMKHDATFDLRSGMRIYGRVVIRNERPLDRLMRSLNTP